MPKGYWSIENIADNQDLWVDGESSGFFSIRRYTDGGDVKSLDAITNTLVWVLPFTNIEEITEENLDEVYIRIRMLEISRGPFLLLDGMPRHFSASDISRRVGLRVIPDIDPGPFEASIVLDLRDRARIALDEERQ